MQYVALHDFDNCSFFSDNVVYGNADFIGNEPNTVSKSLFPAHVREMHRNSNEGFEREFGVRMW